MPYLVKKTPQPTLWLKAQTTMKPNTSKKYLKTGLFALCTIVLSTFSFITITPALSAPRPIAIQPTVLPQYSNPIHRAVIYLDANNFKSVVTDSQRPVLILFTDALSLANNNEQGYYEELAFQYNNLATFAIVDVKLHPNLAKDLGWSITPTIYFLPPDKQVLIHQGYLTHDQLNQAVKAFLHQTN